MGRKLDAVAMEKVAAEFGDVRSNCDDCGVEGAFLFPFGTSDPLVPKARAEEFFRAAAGEKKNAVLGGRAWAERAGGRSDSLSVYFIGKHNGPRWKGLLSL